MCKDLVLQSAFQKYLYLYLTKLDLLVKSYINSVLNYFESYI